jgi:hypothetical protein
VSACTVQRIWHAHALHPHWLEPFKFSTDPHAEEKIHDVMGLYIAHWKEHPTPFVWTKEAADVIR